MIKKFGNTYIQFSEIEGYGLYASADLSAGSLIRQRNILREVSTEFPLEAGERADHVSVVNGRLFLVGEPDCYGNHSCDPNAYLKYDGTAVYLFARRDIRADDQITLDYLINNSGGDSWDCNCGAARCRGKTGHSFFDLPKDFQIEYLPLLADWFRKTHSDQIKTLEGEAAQ